MTLPTPAPLWASARRRRTQQLGLYRSRDIRDVHRMAMRHRHAACMGLSVCRRHLGQYRLSVLPLGTHKRFSGMGPLTHDHRIYGAIYSGREYISETWGRRLLLPMLLLGLSSVIYWDVSGDLSFYAWVQFTPLLIIAV